MFIDDYTFSVKVYILPYILPIIHIALLGSIYSTVALAAERYITICHPFMRYRCALKKKKILGVPRIFFFLTFSILLLQVILPWHNFYSSRGIVRIFVHYSQIL